MGGVIQTFFLVYGAPSSQSAFRSGKSEAGREKGKQLRQTSHCPMPGCRLARMSDSPVGDAHAPTPEFDPAHLTRTEYVTSVIHFYRSEVYRSTAWRIRLDTTTNWAIFSVMALVTFTLGESRISHAGILVGMVLVLTFMAIEARRYRIYDVWRRRARVLEENFVAPILRRNLVGTQPKWGNLVAEDLLRPHFRLSFHQALQIRLLRNYIPLYLLLLVCWLLKLGSVVGDPETSATSYVEAMRLGHLPGWVPLVYVVGLYGYLGWVGLFVRHTPIGPDELWPSTSDRIADIDYY